MTTHVELDRLADYAAGLLDGTPGEAEVAQLVATDPVWARAYTDLTGADRLVRADLRALGGAPEPVPADVAARLDAALAGAERGRGAVVSLDEARRRRRRWTAVAAVAAGVVAFGVFGLPALRTALDDSGPGVTAGGTAADSKAQKDEAPAVGAPLNAAVVVQASGIDYRRDTVTAQEFREGADSLGRQAARASSLGPIPEELTRLVDPFARQACLAAVTSAYGGRAASVDYARFEGVPALVVHVVGPNRIVVAGPSCGLRGKGADERYSTPTR